MPSASIGDGFDFKGHVDPMPRLWDRVSFQYRPALPDEVFEYRGADRTTGKQALAHMVGLLISHVQSWDAKDRAGNLIPLTSNAMGKVHPRILDTMANYVVGWVSPDAEDGEKNSVGSSTAAPPSGG